MNIRIETLISGAREAVGSAVIIDVFRASSSIVAAFGAGAKCIIPVGDLSEAYEIKRLNPSYLLFGERHGLPPEHFDGGNSPPEIARMDLQGKTIVLTTSAGTQGIVSATRADEIVIGSFLNARAVADYLLAKQSAEVTLVAMGIAGLEPTLEDDMCACYIRSLLRGEEVILSDMTSQIRMHPEAAKFFDLDSPVCNPEDVNFSLRANQYRIVPRFVPGQGLVPVTV